MLNFEDSTKMKTFCKNNRKSISEAFNKKHQLSGLQIATDIATKFYKHERRHNSQSMIGKQKLSPIKTNNRLFQIYMCERELALSLKYQSMPNSPLSCSKSNESPHYL